MEITKQSMLEVLKETSNKHEHRMSDLPYNGDLELVLDAMVTACNRVKDEETKKDALIKKFGKIHPSYGVDKRYSYYTGGFTDDGDWYYENLRKFDLIKLQEIYNEMKQLAIKDGFTFED